MCSKTNLFFPSVTLHQARPNSTRTVTFTVSFSQLVKCPFIARTKPFKLPSLNKQWLKSPGILDLTKSTHQVAANERTRPSTAGNSEHSHYFDEGLGELCWRCWERALWWSLSLWSEEQETQDKSAWWQFTFQFSRCRKLQAINSSVSS